MPARLRTGVIVSIVLASMACQRAPEPPPTAVAAIGFERPPERSAQADLRHGDRLARVLGCRGCHGDNFAGEDWSDPGFSTQFTSNLTAALARYSDAEFAAIVRAGRRPDGSALREMPSNIFERLSDADMAALIAWLRTVPHTGVEHPRLVVHARGQRAIAAGEWPSSPEQVAADRNRAPPSLDGRHEPARYMLRATCGECHTVTLEGRTVERGSIPDLDIAAAYTREQFRHLMRTGESPGGRRLRLMPEVARGRFAFFTPREVDAIHDYLIARAARGP